MFCTNCGNKLPDDAAFCGSCGHASARAAAGAADAVGATETFDTDRAAWDAGATPQVLPEMSYNPERLIAQPQVPQPQWSQPQQAVPPPFIAAPKEEFKRKRNRNAITAIIAGTALLLLIGVFFGGRLLIGETQISGQSETRDSRRKTDGADRADREDGEGRANASANGAGASQDSDELSTDSAANTSDTSGESGADAGVDAAGPATDGETFNKALTEAANTAAKGDITGAAALYRNLMSVRPDDGTARQALDNMLGDALASTLDEAKTRLEGGDAVGALTVIRNLPIERGDKSFGEYTGYVETLSEPPELTLTDTSLYPEVTLRIDTKNRNIEGGSIDVTDGGVSATVVDIRKDGSEVVVTYTAASGTATGGTGASVTPPVSDTATGGTGASVTPPVPANIREFRSFSARLKIGGFLFPVGGEYSVPQQKDAVVTLVSADFREYPLISAFFRIEDAITKTYVNNAAVSFKISESVTGGAHVAREAKSAFPLALSSANHGINISLVADKSDSIEADLPKIKTVMNEFVGSITASGRDRAELIAFDDLPQLMCVFTNDRTLLSNGINNMATDGMTAFYDAVYQGVRDAALQGGARCVIAFTDGIDNKSALAADDIIRYSVEKQVPLYIIGAGDRYDSSQNTLMRMADETHGHYWYIDDLYDLREIYTQIYSEMQELYVVTYESDRNSDTYAMRGLIAEVSGGGYKGIANTTFTPVKTAERSGGDGSRYEIFVEDVSWEQANERCLERGGHLVTVTSQEEEEQIITMAKSLGVKYLWLGGYTSYDSGGNVFAHWITGEDFTYANWMRNEPSRVDLDGTPEWYLMLWEASEANGGWTWNDQRNELVSLFSYFKGKIAYVCEYEN